MAAIETKDTAWLRSIRPLVLGWIDDRLRGSSAGVSGALATHDIGSVFHVGTLRNEQAPQFLLRNGSRSLTGPLSVAEGVTIDGVDLSAFRSLYNAHTASADAHHTAFIGLRDDDSTLIAPATDDTIRLRGGSSPIVPQGATGSISFDLQLESVGGLRTLNRRLGINPAIAGDGLSWLSGVLSVLVGSGLQMESGAVALRTPGTLGIATANSPVGSHTHAIAASSRPGARGDLLRTDDSGRLTLWDLWVSSSGDRTGLRVEVAGIVDQPAVAVWADIGSGTGTGEGIAVGVLGQSLPRSVLYTRGALGLGGGSAFPDVVFGRAGLGWALLAGDHIGAARADLSIAGALRLGDSTAPSSATLEIRALSGLANMRFWSPNAAHRTDLTQTDGGQLQLNSTGSLVVDLAGRDILPARSYETNLGSLQQKWLSVHAAELWVETLVAQQTLATIGGRILVGPTTQLVSAFPSGNVSLFVKHNNFQINDILYMEANGKVEFLRVTGTRTNYVLNASFEVGTAGVPRDWSVVNSANTLRVIDNAVEGQYVVRISS